MVTTLSQSADLQAIGPVQLRDELRRELKELREQLEAGHRNTFLDFDLEQTCRYFILGALDEANGDTAVKPNDVLRTLEQERTAKLWTLDVNEKEAWRQAFVAAWQSLEAELASAP